MDKYIEQFSIIKDAEENAFKKKLEIDNSEFSDNYLRELKEIVDVALKIDFKSEITALDTYLESLLDYASKQDKMDIFSKCTLFNATCFEIEDDEELQNNIKAIDTLLSSNKYESVITKYIEKDNMKLLLTELIKIAKDKQLMNNNYQYVNDILKIIKAELEENSAVNQIKDFNIIKYAMCKQFIKKFDYYIEKLKT